MTVIVVTTLYKDMGDALNKLVQSAQGTQRPTLATARHLKQPSNLPRRPLGPERSRVDAHLSAPAADGRGTQSNQTKRQARHHEARS